MTYATLQDAGRALKPAELTANLRTLAADPRFAAVVALLDRNVESWQTAFASQQIAANHGQLAHAAGSLHAILLLRAQLAATVVARKPKAATPADQAP